MKNQNASLDKELEIINNIRYLDFSGLDIFDIDIANKLLENENNLKYKESVKCLRDFMFFSPETFNQKYRHFGIKEEIIDALHNILMFLPIGTLRAKIASSILIEDRNKKYDKPELARIIVENFAHDFDKIFSQNYMQENNIYFTIDVAHKFRLFDELDIGNRIKQVFDEQLNDTINFKFTRLYQTLTIRLSIWNKDEHLKMIHRLYQIAIKRFSELKTMTDPPQAHVEKSIICNILETILFIINKIKKYKTKKYSYIQNKIHRKIVDMNLKFSDEIHDIGMSLEALLYALTIAKELNNKELEREINKKIQLLNEKILKTMKPKSIPLSQEQQDCIEQYEKDLDSLLVDKNKNLFEIFRYADYFYVNFDLLKDNGALARCLFPTIEYDGDSLISNIHSGQDDIFMDYKDNIVWYSCLCYILKTKLLQRFYPQKEYFYPLTYNSNIISEGYEELVARMLYCGIHNDYMDFLIYAGVSIEAILRNILEKNDCEAIINKRGQIQEYETLESMINTIRKKNLLEENEIKEIELLFCRNGFNLRNKIAHARLGENEFIGFGWLCDYLWCFMMRFFMDHYHK